MGYDFERHLRDYFPFGLVVSRASWEWLNLSDVLRETPGSQSVGDTQIVRRLAANYNLRCSAESASLKPVSPGQLITAGMIVELLRYVLLDYCYRQNPGSLVKGAMWLGRKHGERLTERPVRAFVDFFPPKTVIIDSVSSPAFLDGRSALSPNRELVTMESILLMLSMINPAFRPFRNFFDDTALQQTAPYREMVDALAGFFETQPTVEDVGLSLFKTLLAPIENSPESLEDQLAFIRIHWAKLLPKSLLQRLTLAIDIVREERYGRGFSEGSLDVLRFGLAARGTADYPEWEAFSHDADWMSNVVLIAKSTYVWLDQLSKKYQRHVRYLSDIPDEELDRLARWGFNALWLIGVWERSRASQTIKQIMGNPEAMASAYSLYDYNIASDLGGDDAYNNLRERAARRGIRLSADMVPNHVGIFSRWVIEHPQWFIQSEHPPFPVYQYTGINLSEDQRVTLQIEDGYWQHRDAAVVFKRIDNWTGDTRYIYHGNDGTNMPWNDTAQLNFLLPEVREAVIQTILHVARKFPIIRFDAAMTLAKRHYQRLWFPQPGEGGAIPSRAECGMTKDEFDSQIPNEFWREVVDRIKLEVPDTLLLAEAFWLMEGYFVRTLGMHRVYNSAFMNMLKMEENSKYRQTIKNVLEFSPEVLKRFVNFMNNPDEKTAVEQFGKGDKYFGVAMMLVTMPGLPMVGHGQIEGFAEKYGMEYRRAYWDEHVDEEMVKRHEAEIFPLIHKRYLFSGAANFALFDFHAPEGWVDENVFAYSNRSGSEKALVLYNNSFNSTKGWIRISTAINTGAADNPHLVRRTLGEALGLKTGESDFYLFRDSRTHLQYIRSGRRLAEEGLYVDLQGYQFHAFLDWHEVVDSDGSWSELMHRLNGTGVHDIVGMHQEQTLRPILEPLRNAYSAEFLRALSENGKSFSDQLVGKAQSLISAAARFIGAKEPHVPMTIESVAVRMAAHLESNSKGTSNLVDDLLTNDKLKELRFLLSACFLVQSLNRVHPAGVVEKPLDLLVERLEAWRIRRTISETLAEYYGDQHRGYLLGLLAATLLTTNNPFFDSEPDLAAVFHNRYVREFLQVNSYQGIDWFNREKWIWLVETWYAEYLAQLITLTAPKKDASKPAVKFRDELIRRAEESGFKVDGLISASRVTPRTTKASGKSSRR